MKCMLLRVHTTGYIPQGTYHRVHTTGYIPQGTYHKGNLLMSIKV